MTFDNRNALPDREYADMFNVHSPAPGQNAEQQQGAQNPTIAEQQQSFAFQQSSSVNIPSQTDVFQIGATETSRVDCDDSSSIRPSKAKSDALKRKLINSGQHYNQICEFIYKLMLLVENKEYAFFIGWAEAGESIYVSLNQAYAQQVLPLFFKHKKLNSFIRQLNFYGFVKNSDIVDPSDTVLYFSHPNFQSGRPDLLKKIVRRRKGTIGVNDNSNINYARSDINFTQSANNSTQSIQNIIPTQSQANSCTGCNQVMKAVGKLSENQNKTLKSITTLLQQNQMLNQEMSDLKKSLVVQNGFFTSLINCIMETNPNVLRNISSTMLANRMSGVNTSTDLDAPSTDLKNTLQTYQISLPAPIMTNHTTDQQLQNILTQNTLLTSVSTSPQNVVNESANVQSPQSSIDAIDQIMSEIGIKPLTPSNDKNINNNQVLMSHNQAFTPFAQKNEEPQTKKFKPADVGNLQLSPNKTITNLINPATTNQNNTNFESKDQQQSNDSNSQNTTKKSLNYFLNEIDISDYAGTNHNFSLENNLGFF